MESDSVGQPSAALTAISEARGAAADRLITPWWYHPVLGVWLGGYLLAVSFLDFSMLGPVVVVFVLGCALLMNAYRRQTGMWISGFQAGPASRWAVLLAVVTVVSMVASMGLHRLAGLTWPSWALAFATTIAVVVLGRRFDSALRAHLRATV